jgi:murein L,D-transpeptidase YafK
MDRTDGADWPRLTAAAVALAAFLIWGCERAPVEAPPPAVVAPPPAEPEIPEEDLLRLAHAEIGTVERVLVDKSDRRLYLLRAGEILAWAPVSLSREPDGPKVQLGDNRTPEGDYTLDWRNPRSNFYRSIHISYPNEEDLARAFAAGADPGGGIFLHGTPDPVLLGRDWTTGCIAISNGDMDLIWTLVPDGTPITIRP